MRYALYVTNASNHNRLITRDEKGNPFTKKSDAIYYGKGIINNTVLLVSMTKDMEIIK